MQFAKIENERCVNILEFGTEENAHYFDKNLVLVEDGFGIGDLFKDGTWEKYKKSEEEIKAEREKAIKIRLATLDETINRPTEDLYELTNTTPYETVQKVIEEKKELREELQKINGN